LINLFFPVLVLVMFGGLLGGAIAGSVGGYFQFAVPGVLAVTMLFGIETTMTAVASDAAKTITDRFRSLPIGSASVLAGRCLADMTASVLGLAVTIAAGLALGWRPSASLAGMLAAVGLLLWFRFGLLWVGLWAGLKAHGPEAVVSVQILVWPVIMLSTVFVDTTTMPGWLASIAQWNPLSATATAVRDLLTAPATGSPSWPAEHAMLLAVVFPLVATAVAGPISARAYRNLDR